MQSIYVSFTSTPDRLHLIEPMLASLKKQTLKTFTPILWLCNHYSRSNKNLDPNDLPAFLNDPFLKVEFCKDFGSNTKLYPILQKIDHSDALIVTADDDTLYPPHWLEGLVQASQKDPSSAYGYRGKLLKRRVLQFPFSSFKWNRPLSYKASQTLIPSYLGLPQSVDILTGVWGILYRRSFFDETYFNLEDCPEALHNDDLWANGHLARKGIPRICIGLKGNFEDIPMEKHGVKRLWDSVNNGKGLNDKVLTYFKNDFKRIPTLSRSK